MLDMITKRAGKYENATKINKNKCDDSDVIVALIVNTLTKKNPAPAGEEEGCNSCGQRILNVFLHGLSLRGCQRIQLTTRR